MLNILRILNTCSRLHTPSVKILNGQVLYSLLSMSTEVEKPVHTDKIKCFLSCHYASSHGVMLPPPGQPAEDSWRVNYVTGNLFSCPVDEALAHCISEDCRMGAGIAVMFKKEFKGVEELKEQRKLTGQCAVLKRDKRFVYYLITKKKYNQKPTYDSLRLSLEDMKSHCELNGVTRVSMPRIGCGLDRLQWDKVSVILEQVFKHTNISITVYSLPQRAETTAMNQNMRR